MANEDEALAIALLAARQPGAAPARIAIADEAQAYRVQALVAGRLGPIGGWKVGAPGPDGAISGAPMPAAWLVPGPTATLPAASFPQREVESEICFRLGRDLPPRPAPYGRDEVSGALETCHPGLEVLQARVADPATASPLALLADFIQHGAFVVGAPIPGWRSLRLAEMTVTQSAEGGPERRQTGNPAGDMIRLVAWLANGGAHWAGGLRAGQIVTCGSWTGKTAVAASGMAVARFEGAEPVSLRFA